MVGTSPAMTMWKLRRPSADAIPVKPGHDSFHDAFLGTHGTAKDANSLRLIVIGFRLNPV
jgi:hypothetical protein